MDVVVGSPWAQAVFHVLAHVDVGRIAASCCDEGYVGFAAARLGPASQRFLAEDASLLSAAFAEHNPLAHAQALAWIWHDADDAERVTDVDLSALGGPDVRDERALAIVRAAGPGVEILRAATELELPLLDAFEPVSLTALAETDAALTCVARACPELARCRVALIRALPCRGRVHEASIFIGVPGVAGAVAEHLAWQAAHEATVNEVGRRSLAPPEYAATERYAIALLRSRARAVGLGDAHAAWLARIDLTELGAISDVADAPE